MQRANTKQAYMYSVHTQVFKSICSQQLNIHNGTQRHQKPTVAEKLRQSDILTSISIHTFLKSVAIM